MDIDTTIVRGITCKACKNEIPPMTMREDLEGKGCECGKILYEDEHTESLWIGINPRGRYIDFERVSDGFIIKNVHSVGHHVNGITGMYQSLYRNKTTYPKLQHKTLFRKTGKPDWRK